MVPEEYVLASPNPIPPEESRKEELELPPCFADCWFVRLARLNGLPEFAGEDGWVLVWGFAAAAAVDVLVLV